jgi:hypothetical protein
VSFAEFCDFALVSMRWSELNGFTVPLFKNEAQSICHEKILQVGAMVATVTEAIGVYEGCGEATVTAEHCITGNSEPCPDCTFELAIRARATCSNWWLASIEKFVLGQWVFEMSAHVMSIDCSPGYVGVGCGEAGPLGCPFRGFACILNGPSCVGSPWPPDPIGFLPGNPGDECTNPPCIRQFPGIPIQCFSCEGFDGVPTYLNDAQLIANTCRAGIRWIVR